MQAGTVRLFDDTSISSLSFALPTSDALSLGLSMLTLNSGEFERTNELNEVLGA